VFRGRGEGDGGRGLRELSEARVGFSLTVRSVGGDESTVSLLHGAATDWGVLDAGDDAPKATF
jgi:hypothetical protein